MSKPLAIDLFCGLGGWTEGLLSEGYDVIGFDIEAHEYGEERYPAKLVLQDVLTLHGSQFKDAALIVASPPCQEFSYMAMPWTRAKAKAAWYRDYLDCSACDGTGNFYRRDEDDDFLPCDDCAGSGHTGERMRSLTALFDACFRIQREASEAASRHIPLVVENVRGAEPWVGRAKWSFGSYYLWGDVPALMPATIKARKNPGFRFDGSGPKLSIRKVARHVDGLKAPGGAHRRDGAPHTARLTSPAEGRKGAGAGAEWFDQNLCSLPSKSPRRKAASAKIAKIPFALSSWIARTYKPLEQAA